MTEQEIKAIELFAERVKKYYKNYRGTVASGMVVFFIDQALKEFKDVQLQDNVR
jgi:hypothetical protein